MSRDILSEYGPDSPSHQKARATNGGEMPVKEIRYSPPQGPSNINDPQRPGLHGHNCGNAGTQGYHGRENPGTSGSPGLHGKNMGMGTNRKG